VDGHVLWHLLSSLFRSIDGGPVHTYASVIEVILRIAFKNSLTVTPTLECG
jgi:hypothetical protein